MNIVGLITEYNPFHNGHLYHIEQAKKLTNADYVIVIMSGDFVQRGTPAFLSKHLRADIAIHSGADVVLELPVCYATGSAEYFATGAVSLLDKLGCVNSICFGSECGNYSLLKKIAWILYEEPEDYKAQLKSFLKDGLSFPLARQEAIKAYCKDDKTASVLDNPNNILGIEYIKALFKLNSPMTGYTIQRSASDYHDQSLNVHSSSASAIRKAILEMKSPNEFDIINSQLPSHAYEIMKNNFNKLYPVISEDFSLLLRCRLFDETADSLLSYADVSEDLANRIINTRNDFRDFEQYCNLLKTREVTYSRISRALIHILLNIREIPMNQEYVRILGFRKSASDVLSLIKKEACVSLITKLSKTDTLSNVGKTMLEQDIYAANLYENVVSHKFKKDFVHEYSKQLIIH